MMRLGKAMRQSLRALAYLQIMNSGKARLAIDVIWCTTAREQRAVRQLHRKLLSQKELQDGCTIQCVVVPGAWDDSFRAGRKVSDDFFPGEFE